MTELQQLQEILREYTGNKALVVKPETIITADMGLDSYDLAQLIGMVETRFDVEISDRAAMQMKSAGDVVAYIQLNK